MKTYMMERRHEMAKQIAGQYARLSKEGILTLEQIIEPMKVPKGEVFLKEGETARWMFYVEKGMVRQFYYKNERDLTEHISYENNMVICLESYLRQEPTRLLAETLEPTILWRIGYDDINRLSEESREIGLLYRKIFEWSLLVSQRKADILRFETAAGRYKRFFALHPEIVKRAPLIYIANLLQMTPETLSRVRSNTLV